MNKLIAVFIFCLSSLTGSAQILNGDFENWYTDGAGHNRLNDWQHFDFGVPNTAFWATWEVSDASHGAHALKLSRWYSYRSDWVMQKVPVAVAPGIVTGKYKYTDNILMSPYNIDTAVVCAWATVWNSTTLKCDTVGAGKALLMASAAYVPFSCSIAYTDTRLPDSIIIFIKPSIWFNNAVFCDPSAGDCSILTIDDLSLGAVSATGSIDGRREVVVYVDRPGNVLTIDAGNKINEVVVYSTIGQRVCTGKYDSNKVRISIADLPAAAYVVVITDDKGGKTVKRILKQF